MAELTIDDAAGARRPEARDSGRWTLREGGKQPGIRPKAASGRRLRAQRPAGPGEQGQAWLKGKVGAKGELDWDRAATASGGRAWVMGWPQAWASQPAPARHGSTERAKTIVSVQSRGAQ
jgi:hypothetical protein